MEFEIEIMTLFTLGPKKKKTNHLGINPTKRQDLFEENYKTLINEVELLNK